MLILRIFNQINPVGLHARLPLLWRITGNSFGFFLSKYKFCTWHYCDPKRHERSSRMPLHAQWNFNAVCSTFTKTIMIRTVTVHTYNHQIRNYCNNPNSCLHPWNSHQQSEQLFTPSNCRNTNHTQCCWFWGSNQLTEEETADRRFQCLESICSIPGSRISQEMRAGKAVGYNQSIFEPSCVAMGWST